MKIINYKSGLGNQIYFYLFGKYLAFGIMFRISFQTLLNLMVVVGLIPVTGVILRGIL